MGNVYRSDLEQGMLMHDCVSFDLLDTLVMRRVPSTADVFSMVEQRLPGGLVFPFGECRARCEKELCDAGIVPTLPDIYRQLRAACGLDEQTTQTLMEEEWKAECEVMIPRRDMAELLRMAHDSGKTVTVLADTYLSGIQVRDLLQMLEIRDYTMILSAADVGLTRETGLYAHYRALCGEEKSYMHIGDNPQKDGEIARQYGIDTLVIPRAVDLYRRDNPGATVPQDLSTRRILGEKIARQYNSPFA
ncbi:MAG: hypothetical protein IJW99_00595 [Clostridia bacterium]|nr:hypothetical protein [Clostridia bacterium]